MVGAKKSKRRYHIGGEGLPYRDMGHMRAHMSREGLFLMCMSHKLRSKDGISLKCLSQEGQ